MDVPRQIFIAGTGRSGTTQLVELLGMHPEIYNVPMESRFIIDPGGLEDLADDLTSRFTVHHGDRALERFDRLVRQELVGRLDTSFKNFHLDRRIGPDIWWTHVNRFVDDLIDYAFEEDVPIDIHSQGARMHWPSQNPRFRRVVPHWFEHRADLVARMAAFVDGMFGDAATRYGRRFWVEKTPNNLLSMPFLWELFPDAAIIHVTRDPRGVFRSFMKQAWAPDDPQAVVKLLRPVYARWARFRDTFDLGAKRYLQVRLEDLADDPSAMMTQILAFLHADLSLIYPDDAFKGDRVDYWRGTDDPAIALCEDTLGPYFAAMGYEV